MHFMKYLYLINTMQPCGVVACILQTQDEVIYEAMPHLVSKKRHMPYFIQTNASGPLAQITEQK